MDAKNAPFELEFDSGLLDLTVGHFLGAVAARHADREAIVFGDERISYHKNETNLGMVPNWNRQFELAETDLLTLLHQDDCLLPNYVALMETAQMRFIEARSANVLFRRCRPVAA